MPHIAENNANTFTGLTVAGFKSFPRSTAIALRPLTVFAGANSSGKSSAIQPLLLYKQSLEAQFDPGPLLLNGPNVRFTSARQMRWQGRKQRRQNFIEFGFEVGDGTKISSRFAENDEPRLNLIAQAVVGHHGRSLTFEIDDTSDQITQKFARFFQEPIDRLPNVQWEVIRDRCFLDVNNSTTPDTFDDLDWITFRGGDSKSVFSPLYAISRCKYVIGTMIHVPGLRGNPRRAYSVAGIGQRFPGTFEPYTASVIAHWQRIDDQQSLAQLNKDLFELGLTSAVEAKPIDEANIELHVGRVIGKTPSRSNDTVNIADTGFGVSQTLPVLVALNVATPGQLVYIEQPEIHLHPRAQVAMANVLARAAARGVRLIVETHSALMLLAIQTLVAEGTMDPELLRTCFEIQFSVFSSRRDMRLVIAM